MTLNKDTEALLKEINSSDGPQYWEMPIDEARAFFNQISSDLATPAPQIESESDRKIESGNEQINVRVYCPKTKDQNGDSNSLPLIVHLHGGGLVLGSLDAYDAVCRNLCALTPAIVVSVEYRLAPEYTFPVALDDSISAIKWSYNNAESMGADPGRIALVGDSAGGGLVAAATQFLSSDPKIEIGFQVLVYPVTDWSSFSNASYGTFGDGGYLLTKEMMNWFCNCYFATKSDREDPRASPLLATEFKNLPPALIITAGYDPLYEEGKNYAMALKRAGVDVIHKNYAGQIHAFWSFGKAISEAKAALSFAAQSIRRAVC